jgi:hypothetical protein
MAGAILLSPVLAEAATAFGKITSLNDNSNIQGAKIKFVGATTDSTVTDANGDYSKTIPDGIYQILVGKPGFLTFDAKSDTLNGSVRRNAAMFDTAATADQVLEMWGRKTFQGTKKNSRVFDVADPSNPQIKLELSGYTESDSIQIAENKDYFNSALDGREYLNFGNVNDDGITMYKDVSNYTQTSINAQGFIDYSWVHADTTLLHDIHEWGHAIGLYHANSRQSFMNDSCIYYVSNLDKKIVNAGYDHMDAFKDGRTDFYMAQLSDTSIVSGVAGDPISQLVPLRQKILQKIYPSPARTQTTIEYQLVNPVHMKIEVYNIAGQKVKTLLDGTEYPGAHEKTWNLRNDQGEQVFSGLYIVKSYVPGTTQSESGRLLIVR